VTNAYAKIASYILIVILGYALKRLGLFKTEHSEVVSKIIFNITLPCAILTSFHSVEITSAYITPLVFGFGFNIVMLALGLYLARRAKDRDSALMYILFVPSQIVGIFGIPVASAVFSPAVVAGLCLYDIGNATIMFGPSFVLASARADGERLTAKYAIKRLLSSVSFDVYIIAISMSLLKISMPAPVLTFAEICGAGNGFLAMLLFGIMLEPKVEREHRLVITKITLIRLVASALVALPVWFLLPVAADLRIAIVICLAMPAAVAAAVIATSHGVNKALVSGFSAVSLIIGAGIVFVLSLVLA
jgi:predicted permease